MYLRSTVQKYSYIHNMYFSFDCKNEHKLWRSIDNKETFDMCTDIMGLKFLEVKVSSLFNKDGREVTNCREYRIVFRIWFTGTLS